MPANSVVKRRSLPQRRMFPSTTPLDIQFLDSIDSSWKGHQQFAVWLVQRLKPKTIVDLGFDRGLSTLAFACRNQGHVFGVDWFEEGNYAAKSFALDSAFEHISDAIRFNYVKNIHLIIGPFSDVLKKWKRKIDILHIDWAHTYASVKMHYDNWFPFLKTNGLILIHDIVSYPEEVGRFFEEIRLPKIAFRHAGGLGIISQNHQLLGLVQQEWSMLLKN